MAFLAKSVPDRERVLWVGIAVIVIIVYYVVFCYYRNYCAYLHVVAS